MEGKKRPDLRPIQDKESRRIKAEMIRQNAELVEKCAKSAEWKERVVAEIKEIATELERLKQSKSIAGHAALGLGSSWLATDPIIDRMDHLMKRRDQLKERLQERAKERESE